MLNTNTHKAAGRQCYTLEESRPNVDHLRLTRSYGMCGRGGPLQKRPCDILDNSVDSAIARHVHSFKPYHIAQARAYCTCGKNTYCKGRYSIGIHLSNAGME